MAAANRAARVRRCKKIKSEPRSGAQTVAPGKQSAARGRDSHRDLALAGATECLQSQSFPSPLPGLDLLLPVDPGRVLDFFTAPKQAGSMVIGAGIAFKTDCDYDSDADPNSGAGASSRRLALRPFLDRLANHVLYIIAVF